MKRTKHRYTAHTKEYIVFQLKQTGVLFMEFFEILHNFQFFSHINHVLFNVFIVQINVYQIIHQMHSIHSLISNTKPKISIYFASNRYCSCVSRRPFWIFFILLFKLLVRVIQLLWCFAHIYMHTHNAQHIKCHPTQNVNQIKTTVANQTNQLKTN